MESVKCAECGYFAVRSYRDSSVQIASEIVRETGDVPLHYKQGGIELGGSPGRTLVGMDSVFCFKGQRQFRDENTDNVNCLAVIQKERECFDFMSWIPGKTPGQHEEMSIVEQVRLLTAQHRAEEAEERANERRLRQQFEALYEKRHQESLEETRKSRRLSATISIIIASLGLLSSLLVSWLFNTLKNQ